VSSSLRSFALAVCAALAACDGTIPGRARLPAVVFVSGDQQGSELYYWNADTLTRLTSNAFADIEPHVARGRLVFTSDRDGNSEIYITDLQAAVVTRLTNHSATDSEAALHPAGERVVFVSMRSGTPRLWLTDTLAAPPVALNTGSSTFFPERAPAWSPAGDRIAFTSARTGTSQVFVVDATGGQAAQVTSEAGGAFDPAWNDAGTHILYVTGAGTPRLRIIPVAGGAAVDFATSDTSLGEPSCGEQFCVAVRGAYGVDGDLVAYGAPRSAAAAGTARTVLERAENDRQPAVVRP
jgi:Tol biopolymer transport system component